MAETFKDSQLKINRARKHISDLNDHIAAYLSRDPYKLVVETDPEGSGNYSWVMRVSEEFPCDTSAYIGDTIHNLRAALDLLATSLVALNGGNTKDVYWPFGTDVTRFEKRIKKTHIDRAAPDIVDMIRAFKPYGGGNEALRGLHDLDIADKHKALIPFVCMTAVPDLIGFDEAGRVAMIMLSNKVGPLKDGLKVMLMPKVQGVDFGAEFKPAIDISIDEAPFEFMPMFEVLHQLTQLVDGIVQTFVAHFK
jgi:hypothetical protein